MSAQVAEYLVVDSGGFLKNAPLKDLADHVVTLADVVAEIKDKETKKRLQVLPYELSLKQASSEALARVTEFSKKTGDYGSLSATDLRVMALTYDLETQHMGTQHLNKEPNIQKTVEFYKPNHKSQAAKDVKIAGFYNGLDNEEELEYDESSTDTDPAGRTATAGGGGEDFTSFSYWREPLPDVDLDALSSGGPGSPEKAAAFSGFSYWREPLADIGELAPAGRPLTNDELDSLDKFLEDRSYLAAYALTPLDRTVASAVHRSAAAGGGSRQHVGRWLRHVGSFSPAAADSSSKLLLAGHLDEILKAIGEGSEQRLLELSRRSEEVGGRQQPQPANSRLEEAVKAYNEDIENADPDSWSNGDETDDEMSEEEGGDDDDGWITPGNLGEKKRQMRAGGDAGPPDAKVKVACMTTDFAMQNVLKQLGLNIVSVDGMVIRETKTWILRCYSCFRTTPLMSKVFCPKCGNRTLKRVSVTLNADGSQQIHISAKRPLSKKGKKFSLPAPKGGKHAHNPRLAEDQREAQQRVSKKALLRNNPLEPDYVAGTSPFVLNDVTSKASMLGLTGHQKGQAKVSGGAYWERRNPNSSAKRTGNKRK